MTGSIAEMWGYARTLPHAGQMAAFHTGVQQIGTRLDEALNDPVIFGREWPGIVNFLFETGNIEKALSCIARLQSSKAASKIKKSVLHLAAAFVERHGEECQILQTLIQKPKELDFSGIDFTVVTWLRLFNPTSPAPADAQELCLSFTDAALVAAKERGQSCILLPEYLAPPDPVSIGSERVLSFHTHGERHGLHHFKPADLPGYCVLDTVVTQDGPLSPEPGSTTLIFLNWTKPNVSSTIIIGPSLQTMSRNMTSRHRKTRTICRKIMFSCRFR